MYNKIFTKILDSSIWLEDEATRIIWITLLAAMDEDGFACFASAANLAHRARISLENATEAIEVLESPDVNSSNPDNEGRRIEKVPGGWMILNSAAHRDMVKRVDQRHQTRERVRKYRKKQACNAHVTLCNENVTPSDTEADTETINKEKGVDDIGNDVTRYAVTPPLTKAELFTIADMRGVARECVEWFFNKHDAADWLDNTGRAITKPEPLLMNLWSTWRNNKHKDSKPKPQAAQSTKSKSVWTLEQQKKAIEVEMKKLRDKHTFEDAFGGHWTDTKARDECKALKLRADELNKQIMNQ